MPTNTTNFSLIKPGQEDFYNVDIPNANMDIIDGVLKALQDALDSGASEQDLKVLSDALATHLAEDVSEGEVHGMRVVDGRLEFFNGVAWKQVGGGEAAEVVIDDPGNYFTSTEVNGALQEIGYTINGVNGVMIDKVNEILQM